MSARAGELSGYIGRIIDRDFPEAGHRIRNPSALRRWMTAYAAAVSTAASYEKIRGAATGGHASKPSRTATTPYIDTLERLYILDPVPAWSPTRNRLARLTAGPKHHLADPCLAASLLKADEDALLRCTTSGAAAGIPRDGPLLGALFESLAALSLRVYAQACEASVCHLRRRGGDREIDFIVVARDGRVAAVEVKLSRTVHDHDVRHLHWLRHEIGEDLLDAVVLTTGGEAYRRRDGIAVVPTALLGP